MAQRTPWRDLAYLSGSGAALAAIYYLLFARPFPLASLYAVRYMDLGKLTHYGRGEATVYMVGMAALFLVYVAAYRVANRLGRRAGPLDVILILALVQGLVLAATYPIGALDVFAYVFQGRVMSYYHLNPFVVAPMNLPQDPMVPLLAWVGEPSTYGPLWVLAEAAAALLHGDSMLVGLVVYKMLGIALHLLTTYVIYLILASEGSPAPAAGALLFAWNPMMITETAANGHNDVAMAFLAILAVWIYASRRGVLSFPTLTSFPVLMASAMIKFVTLVLFPLFVVAWVREREITARRLAEAAVGLALAGAVAAALYYPFWMGSETIGLLKRGDLFTASPMAVTFYWLSDRGLPGASQVVKAAGGALFVALALGRALLVGRGVRSLLSGSFDVLFAYFVFATFWFQPWYLVILVPFAAALDDPFRRRLAVVFTASAVLNYFVFDYLWLWYPRELGMLQVQAVAAAAIYGPPIGYVLAKAVDAAKGRLARRGVAQA